jgi:Ankyrin repeats (3 copies)
MGYAPALLPPPAAAAFKSLGFALCVSAFLVASQAVFGQSKPPDPGAQTLSNNIEYVPPLAKAVLSRDPAQVDKALLGKEDVNERVLAKKGTGTRAGFTPLILAASLSDAEIAQMLIKRGAKVSILDDFHRSAFWYAALNGNVELTSVLIGAQGASDVVNAADDDLKRTPLHLAVHGSAPTLVQLLVKVGASREQKDVLGETPNEYCRRRRTDACAALN